MLAKLEGLTFKKSGLTKQTKLVAMVQRPKRMIAERPHLVFLRPRALATLLYVLLMRYSNGLTLKYCCFCYEVRNASSK